MNKRSKKNKKNKLPVVPPMTAGWHRYVRLASGPPDAEEEDSPLIGC